MKAVHLRTEHMENPLGLQTVRPVFSWHTDGGLQSAYEIIVRNGKTAVWKSGKVTTGHMLARCGYDAAPREHLTWRIRLWDENDQPGEWNDAWFEMGLLQASSRMAGSRRKKQSSNRNGCILPGVGQCPMLTAKRIMHDPEREHRRWFAPCKFAWGFISRHIRSNPSLSMADYLKAFQIHRIHRPCHRSPLLLQKRHVLILHK